MFSTISKSWEIAIMSYKLIGKHKRLILFPIASSISTVLVVGSFILPLSQLGLLTEWLELIGEEHTLDNQYLLMYCTAFIFYFCNYFIIIFFNTALVACILKITANEEFTFRYGIRFALQRLYQIFSWALLSAFIGILLKAIENSNKKVGGIIAAILGTTWSALTYFVIPIIVAENVGPIEAISRCAQILRMNWGKALVGNFSISLIAFIFMLPIIAIALFLFLGSGIQSATGLVFAIIIITIMITIASAISSAADMIFKTYLYEHATDNDPPNDFNESFYTEAFSSSK